ncbi:hypothetical protein [Haloarchaeobius sp. TZWWS8]|uniref:hypothetical protein n=1 Tax=Haloarchaeobius sp. TZWWS8 TaxID=3446121 RepID=UPI003EBFB083
MIQTDPTDTVQPTLNRRVFLTGLGVLGATALALPLVRAGGDDEDTEGEYTDFTLVTDETGVISVEVPTEWAQKYSLGDEESGLTLIVAPNMESFASSFETETSQVGGAGAIVIYNPNATGDPMQLVKSTKDLPKSCTAGEATEFENANGLKGALTVHGNCGGGQGLLVKYIATVEGADGLVMAMIAVKDEKDIAAAVNILNTLSVEPTADEEMPEEEESESPFPGGTL